ncbi:hypothetical protein [Prevotella melaninogenica]|uniref:hypothetical protein n=1 Tax=Prevotella melaninogenica TaxID=28132 RepID=UPI00068E1DA0|nr:hypothetical protein [Prevotella melaninogenica]
MVYKQSLQEWIDSFQTADVHSTDRHITDFSKQEISKKEWIKKGFLIAESCIEYIRSTDYRIFVYIGFCSEKQTEAFYFRHIKFRNNGQMDVSFHHPFQDENGK